ncbi:MAG TPA: transcription antitermination factor NusB [Phycisphaerales bacterium]|nr:transcription antitermination factor NusB [Phycisphaerales bacterium]
MATPRDIRRLAFQALFQLDARSESETEPLRAMVEAAASEEVGKFSPEEINRAFTLASEAYKARRDADAAMNELAPTWPAHRQPAVDRAILRLAHYEMTQGGAAGSAAANPKVVVNDAIELAKTYSTDRSPAFVNGLLDKVLKRVLADGKAANTPVDSDQ